jgi:hypothetical protein
MREARVDRPKYPPVTRIVVDRRQPLIAPEPCDAFVRAVKGMVRVILSWPPESP